MNCTVAVFRGSHYTSPLSHDLVVRYHDCHMFEFTALDSARGLSQSRPLGHHKLQGLFEPVPMYASIEKCTPRQLLPRHIMIMHHGRDNGKLMQCAVVIAMCEHIYK